jgi:hypothetical protein
VRNHALHPQPDVALALFLLVPPDDGRPAGFPLWPLRNWGIVLTPLLVLRFGVRGGGGQKTLCVWGPPASGPKKPKAFLERPASALMKNPARFPGPGLGTLLLFIHEFRFNVQKSQVEVTSCTEVTGCTTQRNGRPRRFAMSAPLPSAKNCRYRSHFRVVPIAERHLICGLLISCRTTVPALDFKRRKKCRTTLPD